MTPPPAQTQEEELQQVQTTTSSRPLALERPFRLRRPQKRLFVGIPRLHTLEERRIPLTPEGVRQLVAHGHHVRIERGAGVLAGFSDLAYAEAGAELVDSPQHLFEAEIILQAAPPSSRELQYLQPRHVLFSPLQVQALSRQVFEALRQRKITGIAFEYLQDKPGSFPVRRAMSQIAGIASILIASELLSSGEGARAGILLGNIAGVIPPSVVIIGAGVVGEYAAKTAYQLGALVQVFDHSIERLIRLQTALHNQIATATIYPEALRQALRRAHVAIGALAPRGGRTLLVVSEDMVKEMPEGSVIVDVSIDHGGCFETSEITTHSSPTFVKHGVIHCCIPNLPSRYARTASMALSSILTPLLLEIAQTGGLEKMLAQNAYFRSGVYLYRGEVTHFGIAERFHYRYTDLRMLLMSTIRWF